MERDNKPYGKERQKRRIKGTGTVEKVVFQLPESDEEKLFDLSVMGRKIKESSTGEIEF